MHSYSAEFGGFAEEALGAAATRQSALLDVERTEGSPVCESVRSENGAAQGNYPVSVIFAHNNTYFSKE